jgi:hypothetical protein
MEKLRPKSICWPQPLFAAHLEKLVCHARKNGVSDADAACIVHGLVALNFEANPAISERYHERQRIMYEVSPTRRYYYLQWKGPDLKEWELDSYMPALHVELIKSVLDRQELVDAMQKWMAPRGCSSLRVSAYIRSSRQPHALERHSCLSKFSGDDQPAVRGCSTSFFFCGRRVQRRARPAG